MNATKNTRPSAPTAPALRRVASPLRLALLAPLFACGEASTGPGGDLPGNGDVQVGGTVTVSSVGPALSGSDGLSGAPTYGVSVSELGTDNTFDVVFESGRPAPGTYAIGSPGSGVYGELGTGGELYVSFFGEVVITASSTEALTGSSTFNALRLGGLEMVTVTATFSAVCIAVPGLVTCD